MPETVYTHCRYCVALCGLEVERDSAGTGIQAIRPDRQNPYSWQDFCRKGAAADSLRTHPRRIRQPMRRVGDRYEPATYEEAITDIAARLNRIIDEHGPDAVGSYHGNPMGFNFADSTFHSGLLDAIGTGNRYWVGSVDQNNLHVVQEEMYGSELLSLPTDVDDCEYFLLIGMDPAISRFGWIDVIPNGWNRVLAAKAKGAELVIVDPRASVSSREATRHIKPRPGNDWALLLAMIKLIFANGWDRPAEAVPLSGVDDVRQLAEAADLNDLSARCDIPVETLESLARDFSAARTAVCVTHTGVAHGAAGTVGEWLGHVLNAITNRLDVPGGKRYERGYVDLPRVWAMMAPKSKHHTRLRKLPTVAGFHSLAELADEITTPGDGQIRAMLVCSGNPVVSGPNSDALDKAFGGLDLLVAVDLVQRESHRHADWLIPGTHWLEREGLHLAFGSLMDAPFAQYAQRAVPVPDGIMEEGDFFIELALAMGRPMFGFKGVNSLIRGSRKLASVTGKPGLAFGHDWLETLLVKAGRRASLSAIKAQPHGIYYDEKRFGDLAKNLRTADNTVRCAPPRLLAAGKLLLDSPLPEDSENFPLQLINRRSRESMNSWLHDVPALFRLERGNAATLHPEDMTALNLTEGETVRLVSAHGAIELPVETQAGGRRGVVVVPHGWGSRVHDPAGGQAPRAWGANRNRLVGSREIDPLSQTPVLNGTPVRIEKLSPSQRDSSLRSEALAS